MSKLFESYQVDGSNPKCEFIRYTPQSILSSNRADGHLYIDIPREDSVISLKIVILR